MRKVADCRDFPSEKPCTLTIAGEENEVLPVAVEHAVSFHGHERTPELENQIRTMLRDDAQAPRTEPMSASAAQQPRH
jgi:hypothetical protein